MSSAFCSRAAAPQACATASTASATRREPGAKSFWRRARSARRSSWSFRASAPRIASKAIGASVVHALPGVGENLQDHLQLRAIFGVTGARTLNVDYQSLVKRAMMGLDYGLRRRGPLTMAPSQLGLFAKSSPDYSTANIEFHVQPLSLDRFGEPMHPYPAITISVCNLRPESRGSTHAASADPRAAPVIQPNYLSALADQRVAVDSIRLTRRLAAARALARYAPQELKPGANLAVGR